MRLRLEWMHMVQESLNMFPVSGWGCNEYDQQCNTSSACDSNLARMHLGASQQCNITGMCSLQRATSLTSWGWSPALWLFAAVPYTILSTFRHRYIFTDPGTSHTSWGSDETREVFGKFNISLRITLITWEAAKMITGSYFTQRETWLLPLKFPIHCFCREGKRKSLSKLTLKHQLRANVDWSVAGAGLISASNLWSDLVGTRRVRKTMVPCDAPSPPLLSLTPNLRTSPQPCTIDTNISKFT